MDQKRKAHTDSGFPGFNVKGSDVCACDPLPPPPPGWHHALTRLFVRAPWLIYVCDMTHLCVWRASFMCVTCLIRMYDMTPSDVMCWQGSFLWRDSLNLCVRKCIFASVTLTCKRLCVCVCVCVCVPGYVCGCVCLHTHTHANAHTHTHTHAHTRTRTHTHTHTHTHTLKG